MVIFLKNKIMLKAFEHIIEKNSERLGLKISCRLMAFDKKSSSIEQRKKLRKLLLIELKNTKLSKEEKESLLKPGIPPKVPFASISLSHSNFMGGFIIAPFSPYSIGFDLEQWGRAKEKTVLRISNKEELNLAPSSFALWSAKESAYKSLSPYVKPVELSIKPIFVFNWKALSHQESKEYFLFLKKESSKKESSKKKQKNFLKIYDYQFKLKAKKKELAGKGYVCCLKQKQVMAFALLYP